MLQEGWLDEVRSLIAKGYSAELPSMSAIGYGQLIRHLHGEITIDEARAEISHATRMFVRRQANWFKKNDPNNHWFEAGNVDPVPKMEKLVRNS